MGNEWTSFLGLVVVNWCNLEFWIHRSVKASNVCVQGMSLSQECVFRVSFNLIIDTKSSVVNYSDFHSLGVYSFFCFCFCLRTAVVFLVGTFMVCLASRNGYNNV